MTREDVINLLTEIMPVEKVELLDKLGYFKAPASSSRHLCIEGGLAQHSYNVTKAMLKINEDMKLGLDRKHILQVGFLHDICKIGMYVPNVLKSGQVSEARPYTTDKVIELGHGAESIYLIQNDLDIKLDLPVAQAIYWHMGFDYNKDSFAINNLKKTPYHILLVWLTITADTFATWMMETEKETIYKLE